MWPGVLAVAGLGLLAGFLFIPLPYYVTGPGSLNGTGDRIVIEGEAAASSEGEILFTTVSIRQATPVLLLQGWLDEIIDVRSEEEAFSGLTRGEDRVINQKAMDDSKVTATVVALEALGLSVPRDGSGAFVAQVFEDLPAAGLIEQGDVIVGIDGEEVRTHDRVAELLEGAAPGERVEIDVRRHGDGSVDTVELELGEHPDEPGRGLIGVALETADEVVDVPLDVELDSGRVVGPSAGLAWSLGVVDALVEEDVTGGRRIAVTGTINDTGAVGPIGGLKQKAETAIRAEADLFLYPAASDAADVAAMEEIADGQLSVHPVETLSDALEYLVPGGVTPRAPLS